MIDIPGYKIIKELGRGGMATVYLALQESVEHEIALKIMSPQLMSDPSFGERFLREARIISRLSHPNIVAIYDVGVYREHHYISMEYHTGGELKDYIHQHTVTEQEACQITKEIAMALGYAHQKGYVHRDVKPANILFKADHSVVLTDFGIAKATNSATQMTAAGVVIGSPNYMSPEQALGQKIDSRSDLYSLGIVFYELLLGNVPFQADSAVAIGIQHISAPIPFLPTQYMHYQPLINHLLAKDPRSRIQTADEIIQQLDHCLLELQQPHHPQQIINREPTLPFGIDTTPTAMILDEEKRDSTQQDDATPTIQDATPTQVDTAISSPQESKLEAYRELEDIAISRTSPRKGLLIALFITVIGVGTSLFLLSRFYPVSNIIGNIPQPLQQQVQTVSNSLFDKTTSNTMVTTSNSTAPAINDNKKISPNTPSVNPKVMALETVIASLFHRLQEEDPDNQKKTLASIEQQYRLLQALDKKAAQAVIPSLLPYYKTQLTLLLDKQAFTSAQQRLTKWQQLYPENTAIAALQQQLTDAEQIFKQQQTAKVQAEQEKKQTLLNLAREKEIQQLLDNAETAMQDMRLTTPKNNNAYYFYQEILQLQKDHPKALKGIDLIIEYYIAFAQKAIEKKRFQRAQQHIQRIQHIFPNHPAIARLNTLLHTPSSSNTSEILSTNQTATALQQNKLPRHIQYLVRRFSQLIKQKIYKYWLPPVNISKSLKCTIRVQLTEKGEVISAQTIKSSGNATFDRSAENAIRKASPLPIPENSKAKILFRQFNLIFDPD